MEKEKEEREEFEDYHVTEQEIQDMKVEAKEILEENPQLRLLSDEEAEEQGGQDASDTSTFLETLASQRIQRGEISEQEANRGFRQDYIRMRSEAIRKMEILYEIQKRELKSMMTTTTASKQEKQERIKKLRELQRMIKAQRK
jgi:hypothetical protein